MERRERESTTKIVQNTKKMTIVELSGRRNELTKNVHCIRNVRLSDTKVNKTPNKMTVACEIRKKLSGPKMKVKLYGSFNNVLINEINTIKKILNILLLGQKETLRCRRNLNPKKVTKMTQIGH